MIDQRRQAVLDDINGHRLSTRKLILASIQQDWQRKYDDASIDLKSVTPNYKVIVLDNSIDSPFALTQDMVRTAKNITRGTVSLEEKAHRLFNWMTSNVEYGTAKRSNGYRNGQEVFKDREGVCGEMTFLYVPLARVSGLESGYVHVEIDCEGKNVSHACARVKVERGNILVDCAYRTFGCNHKKFAFVSDMEAQKRYESWK